MGRSFMKTKQRKVLAFTGILLLASATGGFAQGTSDTEILTLKRAVTLALQNSRELALARVQSNVAEKTANVNRALFLPNFYTGSGIGYTRGYPQGIGGPPSIFNLTYVQTIFNGPLRGEFRAAEERAEGQRLAFESTRDAVIVRSEERRVGKEGRSRWSPYH